MQRVLSFCLRYASNTSHGKLPLRFPVPGVKQVLLVTSAKGGVGKSTVSVNLAVALSRHKSNITVGLLDADIYGPSVPQLMGIEGLKPETDDKGRIMPIINYGLKALSMGNLVDEKSPIVWRGPIVMSAVQTLLRKVVWGPLDLLVIDMPPGTGDVQISISQSIPIDGAIVVTTPQSLSISSARRGLEMLKKVKIPIFGVVENMSEFICPACGHHASIYENASDSEKLNSVIPRGGLGLAEATGTQLLVRLPIDQYINNSCETGRPITLDLPSPTDSTSSPSPKKNSFHHSASLQSYGQLADLIIQHLSKQLHSTTRE